MVQSLSDYYQVDPARFEESGALDPILTVDTRLFIDPSLLRLTNTPELQNSYATLLAYFEDVLNVVTRIERSGDIFWRTADKLLTFPEVKGLCIGYSKTGTSGSGMGADIRGRLLESVISIINAGVVDPVIFEIVGAFEENIGPDRISDMIAKIILPDLISFTQRVCSDCGIPMETLAISRQFNNEDMPVNPLIERATPIILVPKDILNDLPVVEQFTDIQYVAARNDEVRAALNLIIGTSFSAATTRARKEALKTTVTLHPDVLREILNAYKSATPSPYDFDEDRSGEVIWYQTAQKLAREAQLDLTLSLTPDLDEVYAVVLQICAHFKTLIEDNQLSQLLYDDGGLRKRESAAQLLFYGIASSYCKANNLDLSPEADSGRGPVDFKVSLGYNGRVLVELKLTSNKQLAHGFESQLPIYQTAEGGITKGIYLVIDNGDISDGRRESFRRLVAAAGRNAPRVIMIDGHRRASASVADV